MCLLTFMVPSWTSASGFLLNEHGLKQEMANWQDNKYATKRSDPFLCITEHGSNWKQTSTEHPPSSPHAQLHPQSISPFRFAHCPFWNCNLKTNGKSRSNGGKTNSRREGEGNGMHLNKQSSVRIHSGSRLYKRIRHLQGRSSHIDTMSASNMSVLCPRLGTEEHW